MWEVGGARCARRVFVRTTKGSLRAPACYMSMLEMSNAPTLCLFPLHRAQDNDHTRWSNKTHSDRPPREFSCFSNDTCSS